MTKHLSEKKKLKEIAHISSGLNSAELKKKFDNPDLYTNDDIELDYYQGYWDDHYQVDDGKATISAGDLIINTMTDRVTVVSPLSEGKMMPQYVLRLGLDSSKAYAWYLCYVLNESESVKRQLHNTMEGTVLRRVTAANIRNLVIQLPDIQTQRKIGDLYRSVLIQTRLNNEYTQQVNKAIIGILNKKDINGGH